MYLQGLGVAQDDGHAAGFFKKGCDLHAAQSCNNLGVLYQNGRSVPADLARAKELYQHACDGGDPEGCFNFGVLSRNGGDETRARPALERACASNNLRACSVLAVMFANGEGGPKDPQRALS